MSIPRRYPGKRGGSDRNGKYETAEPGTWRVTSLMPRAAYDEYRGSRENRILGNGNVKTLLIADGTILVAYAVSTITITTITNSGTGTGTGSGQ